MSNQYGTALTWGPLTAPQLFTCEPESYSLRDMLTEQLIEGAAADWVALALHSSKAELNFSGKIVTASTDFIDLSAGQLIAVSALTPGHVIASRAVETWRLNQPKKAALTAMWYPGMTTAGSGASAGAITAFTPAQTGLTGINPAGKIIYGTFGMTNAAGLLQALTLTQEVEITDAPPNPDGTLSACYTHGYKRTVEVEILATSTAPVKGAALTITGAPAFAAGHIINEVETLMETARGMLYRAKATWIPPFAS